MAGASRAPARRAAAGGATAPGGPLPDATASGGGVGGGAAPPPPSEIAILISSNSSVLAHAPWPTTSSSPSASSNSSKRACSRSYASSSSCVGSPLVDRGNDAWALRYLWSGCTTGRKFCSPCSSSSAATCRPPPLPGAPPECGGGTAAGAECGAPKRREVEREMAAPKPESRAAEGAAGSLGRASTQPSFDPAGLCFGSGLCFAGSASATGGLGYEPRRLADGGAPAPSQASAECEVAAGVAAGGGCCWGSALPRRWFELCSPFCLAVGVSEAEPHGCRGERSVTPLAAAASSARERASIAILGRATERSRPGPTF